MIQPWHGTARLRVVQEDKVRKVCSCSLICRLLCQNRVSITAVCSIGMDDDLTVVSQSVRLCDQRPGT